MTPEQFVLAYQAAQTIYSVARDSVRNAEASKVEAAEKPADEVAAVHQRNAEQYQRLLSAIDVTDPDLAEAVTTLGLDLSQLPALHSAVDEYAAQTKSTREEIERAADGLIAKVPAVKSVW